MRAALAGLFLVALVIPLPTAISVLLSPRFAELARQELAPFTPTSLRALAAATDDFLEDRVLFRPELNRLVDSVRVHIPGLILHDSVLVGRDGWLFLSRRRGLAEYRAAEPLSPAELETIHATLAERRDWLAAFGIEYRYLAAPEKWEIYPEMMPPNIALHGSTRQLDQVIAHHRASGGVPIIDPRPVLLDEKASGRPVYFLTDTHWTDHGSWAVAQEMARQLAGFFPGIRPEPLKLFTEQESILPDGNLARMAGLARRMPEPTTRLLPPSGEFSVEVVEDSPYWTAVYTRRGGRATGVRAVIFTDSFGPFIAPFLARHFDRAVFLWRPEGSAFDPDLVLRERPHVVIQELGQLTFAEKNSFNEQGIAGYGLPVTGSRITLFLPGGKTLRGFTLNSASGDRRRATIELTVAGEPVGAWRLGRGRRRVEIDLPLPGTFSTEVVFTARADRPGADADDRPDVEIETGGRPSGYCLVTLDGVRQSRSPGINLYYLSARGVPRHAEHFRTDVAPDEAQRLAETLRELPPEEGYLVLVSRGRAFAHLAPALGVLRERGLHPAPTGGVNRGLIAVIDRADGRLLAERNGSGRLRLKLGGNRPRAAFTLSGVRVE